MSIKNLMTYRQVIDYVKESSGRHWSKTYIYELIKVKNLKSVKLGYARFFYKKDIDKVLAKLTKPSPRMPINRIEKEALCKSER